MGYFIQLLLAVLLYEASIASAGKLLIGSKLNAFCIIVYALMHVSLDLTFAIMQT